MVGEVNVLNLSRERIMSNDSFISFPCKAITLLATFYPNYQVRYWTGFPL